MKITKLSHLSGFSIQSHQLTWLIEPKALRAELLKKITNATHRIYLTALYLEDDEAGREVFLALIQAKKRCPELDIKIFVDFHRAQRGRIGEEASQGNAAMYRNMLEQHHVDIKVYGVPVKTKEVFGVLHLKGFIVDDSILYTGASINNAYFHQQDTYRIDRYHVIEHAPLAHSMAKYINDVLLADSHYQSLLTTDKPTKKDMNKFIRCYKRRLTKKHYEHGDTFSGNRITPLVGLGTQANQLNKAIVQLLRECQKQAFICTPYFNLPANIRRILGAKLRAGCRVEIVVGDKTSNDFYISPDEKFSLIGIVPYLYEQSLRRFVKSFQWAIEQDLLHIHLWKHQDNSYHVKGLSIDDTYHLLTGNNLNPRAWSLDLENALLLQDHDKAWTEQFAQEKTHILEHTTRIMHYSELEEREQYPLNVAKLLKRLNRFRLEKLIQRIL